MINEANVYDLSSKKFLKFFWWRWAKRSEAKGMIEMMIFLVMIIACILGAIVGLNAPMISYTYSSYLAIAIIAALDSVFGGIASVINKKFDMKIFISGFFGNAVLAILLTVLGEKLNVDIYLAAIVVFVWRMFMNLGTIRRYYVEKWTEKIRKKSNKENGKNVDEERNKNS
mgnify:CR=1 FL=1